MELYKQTISSDQEREQRRTFWHILKRCVIFAIVIDTIFFFFFHTLDSPILAWVNVGSIVMYAVAYHAIKHKKNKLAASLIWTEVLLHAALGVLLIGWESGFHYYFLMFIPAICLSTKRKPAVIALSSLFMFYVALNLLKWIIEPLQPIHPLALNVVHIFNLSVVFMMFSYLSFYYLQTVRRAQKKLHMFATTDPLTSLFNRRHMTYLADREIQRINRSNNRISVVLIDLDYFKKINDEHGHKIGDDVLINVAKILSNEVRKQDLIARWGGEEFLVILPDSDGAHAQLSAERIRKAFLSFDWFTAIGESITPTITAGVSEFGKKESLNSVIARADSALYKGKHSGRNVVIFDAA